MKTGWNEFERMLNGVTETARNADGSVTPYRYTSAQRAVAAESERFLIRACASAGVVLAMETDAEALELVYRVSPGSSKDRFSFDILADGVLYRHFAGSIAADPEGVLRAELPEGTHTVEVWLPCLAKTDILSFELRGAGFARPVRKEKKLLCMGDSITQGYIGEFPSMNYTALLAQRMDAELLNQSIGGERFHPEMLDPDMAWKPTHILIAYGTNDWATKDRASFTRDAAEFVRRACTIWPHTPMAMLTPIWRADTETAENRPEPEFSFAEARAILEGIAAEHPEIVLIRGEELFPPIAELMADGYLHPNDAGFAVYADAIAERLPEEWFR